MYFEKEIERYYKDSPGFKKLQGEMVVLAEQFLNQELENKCWQGLSLEEQAIQAALIVFDLLEEGKSKEEALVELIRFRNVKYAPEIVDRIEEMYKKGAF